MLLSMFISFLLARRFGGRMYVPLMIVGLVLVSFFSVGIPEFRFGQRVWPMERNAVLLHNPVPLSFPLYASSVKYETDEAYRGDMLYQLYLFNFVIREHLIFFYSFIPSKTFNLGMFDYVLYYSFFMLVNMVGAILGYWLGKATFIDHLFKKGTKQ